MKVKYMIDKADWTSGHDDRDRCETELELWFNGLSLKTQLSIYYAQHTANALQEKGDDFDPWNDGCPVLQQVFDAENRVLEKFAPWALKQPTGFNFSLFTTGVARKTAK